MKRRFLVNAPHYRSHVSFFHELLGGDIVEHYFSSSAAVFPSEVLAADGPDVIWFFPDLYPHLHPLLKGKQVLTKHGLCFGPWLNRERADSINRYIDAIFQTGHAQDVQHVRFGINPEKIKQVGYSILFQIPDIPVRENAVLFSSTCFRHWNHYDNLLRILRRVGPDIEGYLSVHPSTAERWSTPLRQVCDENPHLTLIRNQSELLAAYARCRVNVSGGVSSVCAPFWFQQKPVIFLRGWCGGHNPFRGYGWARVRHQVGDPLFNTVLSQSTKISDWRQYSPELIRTAAFSPAANRLFYPWNRNREETSQRILALVAELES